MLFSADTNKLAVRIFNNSVAQRTDHGAGITGGDMFQSGTNERRLRFQQRNGLPLHVGAHEGPVRVVVFQERNQGGSHADDLLGGHVHIIHFTGGDTGIIRLAAAEDQFTNKLAISIQRRIGLGHRIVILVVSGQHFNFISENAAVIHFSIGRFKKAEVVNTRIRGERSHQADVGAFRGFNGANAAIVGGMHVAHFKPCTLPAQTARPQSAETALMGQFRQGVNLVHEMR
ncbi:MAG: hypothetical protein BWY09_02785 [Candidatus Hydrogenedentes bacterium ADurb.Bin179]|nr:MAG: hypothetical protein BWY09_02785 [Candidatus Hydrogenedentes bacterium ADurb.Bin179]